MRNVANPLPVLEPFLRGVFQELLDEKGWDYHDLAKRAGLSPNYVRRVTLGTVKPQRKGLKSMCAGAGFHFETLMEMWRGNKSSIDAEGIGRENMRDLFMAERLAKPLWMMDGWEELSEIYTALPQEAQIQVLSMARDKARDHGFRFGIVETKVMLSLPPRVARPKRLTKGSTEQTAQTGSRSQRKS